MIAKLGSAARASGSLPSGSDFKVWRALGAQMGPGRCGLACCGDEARAQRKRPPRRNRAGALLESFHHTSSDCRTQESTRESTRELSVARDMSGFGSTRSVRFSAGGMACCRRCEWPGLSRPPSRPSLGTPGPAGPHRVCDRALSNALLRFHGQALPRETSRSRALSMDTPGPSRCCSRAGWSGVRRSARRIARSGRASRFPA